jgi:hypothetical protein
VGSGERREMKNGARREVEQGLTTFEQILNFDFYLERAKHEAHQNNT